VGTMLECFECGDKAVHTVSRCYTGKAKATKLFGEIVIYLHDTPVLAALFHSMHSTTLFPASNKALLVTKYAHLSKIFTLILAKKGPISKCVFSIDLQIRQN
jgi:hypothetical protein